MRYDVVIVGGGTAGCVLAARLSEDPGRSVCLLEAGPDYGPRRHGAWPSDLLDPSTIRPDSHTWGSGGEDDRALGGRVLGGSSAVNACVVVEGSRSDYDEWGEEWKYERFRPYLERARTTLRAAPANSEDPGPFHAAFVAAGRRLGYPPLANLDAPAAETGVGPYPANVVDGIRWNAALAYLDGARERPNLTLREQTLVDRVELEGSRARAVLDERGDRTEGDLVVLTAGAYFSPAILIRSGIGPAEELRRLGVPAVVDLPVGERLLDHCGTEVTWDVSEALADDAARRTRAGPVFVVHGLLKARSSRPGDPAWDLHLMSVMQPPSADEPARATILVFDVKPLSSGTLALRSTAPADVPLIRRGFLSEAADVGAIVDGIGLARELATTTPLDELLGAEILPASRPLEEYVRSTVRNYFHPAATCAMGTVVDERGHVHGIEGLVVADASIMPTIPRANTNLTTAAIAERIAETLRG